MYMSIYSMKKVSDYPEMDCLRAEKMERNETCDPTETPGPELPCFTMLEQILRSTMDVSRTAEVGHIICGLYGKLHQFQKKQL